MGGLPIQMPFLGRTIQQSSVDEKPDLAVWVDDSLPRLFGYFLPRVGGNVQTAEDLTQETMLAAVRANTSGGTVVLPMPWLFGIARHKLVDHYRTSNRHPDSDADVTEFADDTDRLPRLDLNAIHVRDAVIVTLDNLPVRQRLAIVLRYLDDLPVADVADILDLSLQATESLLARARRTFRSKYLASNGDLI